MGAIPVIQTILNDLIFFIAGGVIFNEAPTLYARVSEYVRTGRKGDNDDRRQGS